jgi:HEAT repeat protein
MAERTIVDYSVVPVSFVLQIMETVSYKSKLEIIHALGEIGGNEAVACLKEIYRDLNEEGKIVAVKALGEIGGREARKQLKDIIQGRNGYWSVRTEVFKQMAKKENKEADECAIKFLVDTIVKDAKKAEELLNRIEEKKAEYYLKAAFDHADYRDMRRNVLRLIAKKLGKESIDILCEACNDKDSGVQLEAVKILCETNTPNKVPVFQEHIKRYHEMSSICAALDLERHGILGGNEFLKRNLDDDDYTKRKLFVEQLGETGAPNAVTWLLKTLKDNKDLSSYHVVIAAVKVLGFIGTPEIIPYLEKARPNVPQYLVEQVQVAIDRINARANA